MKLKNIFIWVIAVVSIMFIMWIFNENPLSDRITDNIKIDINVINGTFYKNLGHPFSGSAIMSQSNYYRISGIKAKEINDLSDGTRLKVMGIVSENKRMIPQAGDFVQITEKTINATSFELIE